VLVAATRATEVAAPVSPVKQVSNSAGASNLDISTMSASKKKITNKFNKISGIDKDEYQ
jgi:hypothetical protein